MSAKLIQHSTYNFSDLDFSDYSFLILFLFFFFFLYFTNFLFLHIRSTENCKFYKWLFFTFRQETAWTNGVHIPYRSINDWFILADFYSLYLTTYKA